MASCCSIAAARLAADSASSGSESASPISCKPLGAHASARSRRRPRTGPGRAAAGLQDIADGIVAGLRDGESAAASRPGSPRGSGRSRGFPAPWRHAASKSACGRLGPVIRHQLLPVDRRVAASTAASTSSLAGRAAARPRPRHRSAPATARARRRHQAGIGDLRGDLAASGNVSSSGAKAGSPWTSTRSKCRLTSSTVSSLRPGLRAPAGCRAPSVTSAGLGVVRRDRLEQRQQLEAHLPPAEGKGLDNHDIGLHRGERCEQHVAAARLEGLVDRRARCIGELGEAWSAAAIGGSATLSTPGPGKPATGVPPVTTVTSNPSAASAPAIRLARARWPMPSRCWT